MLLSAMGGGYTNPQQYSAFAAIAQSPTELTLNLRFQMERRISKYDPTVSTAVQFASRGIELHKLNREYCSIVSSNEIRAEGGACILIDI